MDMNVSTGSISEDGEMSDVNITHSSENDDDDLGHPARRVSASSGISRRDLKHRNKQVSESETDYDEENGEMDPLARMLSTPTHGEESNDGASSEKMLKLDDDKKSDGEFVMPKSSSSSSAATPPAALSPSKESEKEAERRAEARSKREAEEEEREKMQVLVSNFTEEQLDRYEMYRRSAFPKAAIKRVRFLLEFYLPNHYSIFFFLNCT